MQLLPSQTFAEDCNPINFNTLCALRSNFLAPTSYNDVVHIYLFILKTKFVRKQDACGALAMGEALRVIIVTVFFVISSSQL